MTTSITTDFTGEIGAEPRLVRITTTDDSTMIMAENWLQPFIQSGYSFSPTDFLEINFSDGFGAFKPTFSAGNVTLKPMNSQTNESASAWVNNLAYYMNEAAVLGDSGIDKDSVITTSSTTGFTTTTTTASATPGTLRAFRGQLQESATTMTSGNIVGIRGEVDMVGASGGFIYGAQGKVIATGTLSGSAWTAAVFGQFDFSAATINAGQCSALWGDWGATGATATDLTGCRGVAFTNTTSNVLNAQDYRYGNATYLQELAGAGGTLNYYENAGTSGGSAGDAAHCAAQKVIRILVNGVAAYIPVFTQNT